MKTHSSIIRRCTVLILAMCMNLTLAEGNKSIGNSSATASTNPPTKRSESPARSSSALPTQLGSTAANESNTPSNRNRTGHSPSPAGDTAKGNSSGNSAGNFSTPNPKSNDSNKPTTQSAKPGRIPSSGETASRTSRASGGSRHHQEIPKTGRPRWYNERPGKPRWIRT